MKRIHIFRYLPEVDAFDVTPEYAELAELVGLVEWNPVVWIGRLFRLDNDVGEHWFDNWDLREERTADANRHGLDANALLILDPHRFADGTDGPCNTPDIRLRFWRDVLTSLELTTDLLFAKARDNNNRIQEQALTIPELREDWIEDLEARITAWRRDHNDDG